MSLHVRHAPARAFAPPEGATRSEAFRAWFGRSAVVDAEGAPRAVYHGTEQGGFAAFEMPTSRKTKGTGVFFTSSLLDASTYARSRGEIRPEAMDGAEEIRGIYAVYLSLQDPLVVDAKGANWDRIPFDEYWSILDAAGELVETFYSEGEALAHVAEHGGQVLYEQRLETTDDLARLARDMGHDGLILRNLSDDGPYGQGYSCEADVFVAFDPCQIKSIHNAGSWDPASPDLLDRTLEPELAIEEDELCLA